ncbi:hypothetical protein [Streptomyces lavendulae]|uniref:hypothetical protein n=1 Tax=Streptomyces lavendulae TaxID=1914 RepID=UPI00380A929F
MRPLLRRRGGRPTKLSPEVVDRLTAASKAGSPTRIAAGYAGISERSFMNWMARGRRAVEARDEDDRQPDKADLPYVALFEQVSQARSEAALQALVQIRAAARDRVVLDRETIRHDPKTGEVVFYRKERRVQAGDWRAAAWFLEHVYPQHYGRNRQRSDWEDVLNPPAQLVAIESTPDFSALAERLQRTLNEHTTEEG